MLCLFLVNKKNKEMCFNIKPVTDSFKFSAMYDHNHKTQSKFIFLNYSNYGKFFNQMQSSREDKYPNYGIL